MTCKICAIRRPKRSCPAVSGEICSICCGQQREMTLDCPLDCEYLEEARKHEVENAVNPDEFPNQDVRLSDKFLRDNEELLVAVGRAVLMAGLGTPGAVDFDVREALAALIRTQRTLESGLYYETRPENTVAAELCRRIQEAIAEFRRQETERLQMTRTRDTDVLGMLVFLQRLEITRNNGRKRGRAFLDFMRRQLPGSGGQPAPAPLGIADRNVVRTGIVIFAHGSSVASANEAVRGVAESFARQGGFELVEAAFLEQGKPDLAEAVARVIARGAARVLVVPYFLTLGLHLQRDLPRIVADISRIQPGVEIRVTPPLDGHPAMVEALIDRARDGEKIWE